MAFISFTALRNCIAFAVIVAIFAQFSTATAAEKPNILMIFTDDMGYGDISSFSNALPVQTPNIDRLADDGMKFTQFYVSMPICSPSRAAVLSGMYSPETRLTNYLQARSGNNASDANDWMDPDLAFLPKSFQAAGYATGHVGKWHLGGGRDVDNAPSIGEYGYDEFYSTWESPNPDPQLGVEFPPWNKTLEPGQVPRHQRTEYMVNRTLDFFQRHADQPCFVTLWPDDLHTPFRPSPAMLTKYGGDPNDDNAIENFYGVLEEYDRQIGRLLDGLEAQGIDDNTIVFFTGDNGPSPVYAGHLRTDGLRGRKLSLYEGGIREPFIIRWPGHIAAGSVNTTTILSSVDLLPTLTSMAGIPMSAEAQARVDGEDLSLAMTDTSVERSGPLFWEYGRTSKVPRPGQSNNDRSPVLAIRDGDYKLFTSKDNNYHELYNVRIDPKETNNIAASHPTMVSTLAAQVIAWSQTLPHRSHPYPVFSPVNFNLFSITEVASASELRAAAGATSTSRIDGVATYPNGRGDVFAIHVDGAGNETILRIDDGVGNVTTVTDSARIAEDLGVSGAPDLQFISGFDYSAPGDMLYIGENSLVATPGEVLLIGIEAMTGQAHLVARSLDLEGLNDHAVLPYGDLVGVRGEGSRSVGTIDFRSGSWTPKIMESELVAAAPGAANLPPQAAGVNDSGGESYIFAGDDLELFKTTNVTASSPGITRIVKSPLSSANLQDIVVDQAGNMLGLDEAGLQLVIIRAGDEAVFTVPYSAIASALGGSAFMPVQRRGMATHMIEDATCDVYLAGANSGYGVIRIRFGAIPAAIDNWTLYAPSYDD